MIKVAVIIPIYKPRSDPDDLISLRHLKKYLNKYDKYFVAPDGLIEKNYKQKTIKFIKFSRKYFSSRQEYNKLLLQEDFYKKFIAYDFILIYQLDALVFSDKLIYWCKKNYDYIAAPWFSPIIGWLTHKKNSPPSGGNGGFSLRKVKSVLKVLEVVKKNAKRQSENKFIRILWFLQAVLSGKSHEKWLNAPADNYPFNEDGFWALEAPKYLKGYKVAPFNEALGFGFERFPEKCFKLNSNLLPFGTHAWKKYGEKFWEPYILKK